MPDKITHHDNPPAWMVALREQFNSSSFCGCYEGDMDGTWHARVPPGQQPHYTISDGLVSNDYVMGEGQERLIEFIRSASQVPRVEAALAIARNYEKAPCFAELLGAVDPDNPCTCPSCALRAIVRALTA